MKYISMAILIVLTACTTVGTKFDPEQVDKLQPGVSTSSDAIQLLGKPVSESALANNSKLLQWQYAQGTIVGGSGAHIAILFDDRGKMIRITQKTVIR